MKCLFTTYSAKIDVGIPHVHGDGGSGGMFSELVCPECDICEKSLFPRYSSEADVCITLVRADEQGREMVLWSLIRCRAVETNPMLFQRINTAFPTDSRISVGTYIYSGP